MYRTDNNVVSQKVGGRRKTTIISIEKIKVTYFGAGKIVTKFGDKYLTVFERLRKELAIVESTVDLKTLDIKIGRQSGNESLGG